MKIYKTQNEVEKDVIAGELAINDSVTFLCDLNLPISLRITGNINAKDINAWNINAEDINVENITAGDINAGDIKARDIIYFAFCCVYKSILCNSIKSSREIHQEPICLDGKLIIKEVKK